MADTISIALVGALILTLTFVPVMCWYWFKKGVHERVNKPSSNGCRRIYAGELEWCLNHPKSHDGRGGGDLRPNSFLVPFIGGEFMPHLDEARCGSAPRCPTPSLLTKPAALFAPGARHPHAVPDGHRRRLGTGPPR